MLFELVRFCRQPPALFQKGGWEWALVMRDLILFNPLKPVVFRQPGGLLGFLSRYGFDEGYAVEKEGIEIPDAMAEDVSELEFWQGSGDKEAAAYASRSLVYLLSAHLATALPEHLFRKLEEQAQR